MMHLDGLVIGGLLHDEEPIQGMGTFRHSLDFILWLLIIFDDSQGSK